MSDDRIDDLVASWKKERPDLDASAMNIVGRIIFLGRMMEKRASEVLKDSGIYYTDLDVLATLRRSGHPFELSPTRLLQSVLITSGAMTALLNRLEKMELIDRKPDAKDGRVMLAALSVKGKKLIDKAIEVRFLEAHKAVSSLDVLEKDQLTKLLKKLS